MKNQLIISATIPQNTTYFLDLLHLVEDAGGRVAQSKLNSLGNEVVIFLLIDGSWDVIAKLESTCENFRKKNSLPLLIKRTTERAHMAEYMPYSIHALGAERTDVVLQLYQFLLAQGIHVEELLSLTYVSTLTQCKMGLLTMLIFVPQTLQVSTLRENFMVFCEDLNLDAVLEPDKS